MTAITVPRQHLVGVDVKAVKSAMQTFVIPLSNIQGVNLTAIKSVFFDFTPSGLSSETGAVIVASIEAWK